MKKGWTIWVMGALLWLAAGCALQDDVVIMDRRVQTLQQKLSKQEKEMEGLRSQVVKSSEENTRSAEDLRSRVADMRAVLDELRDDLQSLKGRMEEERHDEQQIGATESRLEQRWQGMDKSLQSAMDRVVRLEQYLGLEPSEKLGAPAPAAAPPKPGQGPPSAMAPEQLYALGKQQFDQGEYEKARETFQAFLKQHPKSENADNAQFWLGEVYYREKWYEKAILEYQKVIEGYPKGNKVRSALLKQGFAFLNLGDKDNAKLILRELVRKYPDSNEAKIAKDKLDTI